MQKIKTYALPRKQTCSTTKCPLGVTQLKNHGGEADDNVKWKNDLFVYTTVYFVDCSEFATKCNEVMFILLKQQHAKLRHKLIFFFMIYSARSPSFSKYFSLVSPRGYFV